jgi:hypothetical protein
MQDNNLSSKSKELNNNTELRVTVNDPIQLLSMQGKRSWNGL